MLPRTLRRGIWASWPLWLRLLVGNLGVVASGALLGTYLTVWVARHWPGISPFWLVGVFSSVGFVLSLAANYWLVRWNLAPLERIQAVVRTVRRGETSARVQVSENAPPALRHLADVLNAMLEHLDRQQQQLKGLSHRLLTAYEEERERVARELHDGIGQSFTALLLSLSIARESPTLEACREELHLVERQARQIAEEIRRISHGLHPSTLRRLGLAAALEELAVWVSRQGCQVDLEVDPEATQGLTPDQQLALYRIAQEGVHNALRHGRASLIRIQVTGNGEGAKMEVVDNGRGFSPEKVLAAGQGIGLLGMKERANLAGGGLEIESRPGWGTRIRVQIPSATGRASGVEGRFAHTGLDRR